MYTDWNLKAEHSKNPERDVLIMTNHPALKHHMEVKPKGLHKQMFNFIPYYELLPKRYNESERNKLIHAVQNIPNPDIIRIQLGMLLKLICIYGNIGSVSAELDKDAPCKGYENAQNQITSYYMANHIKIIPEVIGTQIPPKGKVNDLPSELRQIFANQHHFLCTGALPIPAITECKYSKFKLTHDMMMQMYNTEQNNTQIAEKAKRVMYLRRPLTEQHELINHLCQASYMGVHMIIKKNYEILRHRLDISQRYKKRAGRTDKQPTVQDLLDINWIAKLGELSNQSIKLHKLLFKTCIEAQLLIITTTTSKIQATSKDQRRAWPTKLMRRTPFPFSPTYFTDTEDANEQGTEELLFRDLWHQQSITWLATDAALLACTHQQIATQYNDISRFRSQSIDEVITKMSGDTSAETYWTILPEPAQTMLRRNYNTIL